MNENEEINEVVNTNAKHAKIKSKIRFTRFVLLLVACIVALVVLFVNRDKLNIDNIKRLAAKIDIGISHEKITDNSVVDYDYNSQDCIAVFKDGIARLTNDSLIIMDNAGTQFQSVLTGFISPALVSTDKYVLAYDRGEKRLIVTNSFTTLFDKTFDDNIVTAVMNDSGYFAVITESDAYKNKLFVYDSSFNEIYKLNSLNRYLITADISKDNKSIVLSAYYVKDDNVIPQICCYKFGKEESVWNVDFQDQIAVDVNCNGDGSITALFEWGFEIIDSGKEKAKIAFDNKIVHTCDIHESKYKAFAYSSSQNGNATVCVFNNFAKIISETEIPSKAVSLDVLGDRLAVLTRDKFYIYTTSGKFVCERENSNNGNQILFSDKNTVLCIGDSETVYNIIE